MKFEVFDNLYNFPLVKDNLDLFDDGLITEVAIFSLDDNRLDDIFEILETDSGAGHIINERAAWLSVDMNTWKAILTFLYAYGINNIPFSGKVVSKLTNKEKQLIKSLI
jgi:hypothetical protein